MEGCVGCVCVVFVVISFVFGCVWWTCRCGVGGVG